jgi:hypothetical protein
MEEGWLTNNAQNWNKGRPFGKVLSEKLGSGKPVAAYRCPNCGEVKIYTTENLKK